MNKEKMIECKMSLFGKCSSIPNSARTIDSGISNEDETRPPTNSSLPIDRSSCSPQRAQRNRQPIVEEHEEHDDDVIEAVSALPTFIPDSGASSLIEPATEQSDEALNLREAANAMLQRGRTVQTDGRSEKVVEIRKNISRTDGPRNCDNSRKFQRRTAGETGPNRNFWNRSSLICNSNKVGRSETIGTDGEGWTLRGRDECRSRLPAAEKLKESIKEAACST
uniref:Uncharacterized protein n=1 Tax=Caenorhabditis japonica TaxID=281687 RepID=A0A8R1ENQ5_CAEJA